MGTGSLVDVGAAADSLVTGEIGVREFGAPDFTELNALVKNAYTAADKYATQNLSAAKQAITALQAAASALAVPFVAPDTIVVDDTLSALKTFTGQPFVFTPEFTFNYDKADSDYTAGELSTLVTALDNWVKGTATALPAVVEFSLWNQRRESNAELADKKYSDAARVAAARGYTKAPGVLGIEMTAIAAEEHSANDAAAREISAKQADLERENRQRAIKQAIRVHGMLIAYLRDKLQRALDASAAVMNGSLAAFSSNARSYGAVTRYAAAQAAADAQLGRAQVDTRIAQARLSSESQLQSASRDVQAAILGVEELLGAAAVTGQLASSALAAINLSGGISSSQSWGMNVSDSRERSVSASISSRSGQIFNYTP